MVFSSRVRSPSSVRVGKNSTEIVGRAARRASARMSRMKRIRAEPGSAPEIVARLRSPANTIACKLYGDHERLLVRRRAVGVVVGVRDAGAAAWFPLRRSAALFLGNEPALRAVHSSERRERVVRGIREISRRSMEHRRLEGAGRVARGRRASEFRRPEPRRTGREPAAGCRRWRARASTDAQGIRSGMGAGVSRRNRRPGLPARTHAGACESAGALHASRTNGRCRNGPALRRALERARARRCVRIEGASTTATSRRCFVPRRLKTLLLVGSIAFVPSQAFPQTSASTADASLNTPAGHEVNFGVGGYEYVEPGDTSISIHGPKFGGGYTGTMSLNRARHWFVQADAQGVFGSATYDGWCSPYLITPNSASPNGYALHFGDPSPCNESGDKDWYVEGRALVGKDFIGDKWGWAPDIGLGIRHLSNGTAGVDGFRTDDYLYLMSPALAPGRRDRARRLCGSRKGSFKLAQATSCEDFFDRAMSWKLPSHNLICGDKKGNIALMVTGLAPDRDGWTGRLPVPGQASTSGRDSGATCRASTTRRAATSRPPTTTRSTRTSKDGRSSTKPRGTTDIARIVANPPAARQADCRAQAVHHRGHGAHPAGRLLAARRARRAALQGMDGKRSERRESTRHDRRVGSDPHEGHDPRRDLRPMDDDGRRPKGGRSQARARSSRRSSSRGCRRR